MRHNDDSWLIDALKSTVTPLSGDTSSLLEAVLVDLVGDARIVLLGEASHGTARVLPRAAAVTRRLIEREGASPPSRSRPTGPTPTGSTATCGPRVDDADAETRSPGFRRFPTWMWRNTVVARLRRLAARVQRRLRGAAEAGFYGLDLYSLHASMEAVLALPREGRPGGGEAGAGPLRLLRPLRRRRRRPTAMQRSRRRRVVRGRGRSPSCRAPDAGPPSTRGAMGASPRGRVFYAEQNARLVRTPRLLSRRCSRRPCLVVEPARPPHGRDARGAARAPRSRTVGRARSSSGRTTRTSATRAPPQMGERGELNVGQLARERLRRRGRWSASRTYEGW